MQLAGIVERNDDVGAVAADHGAGDAERLARRGDGVGDGHQPGRPVVVDADQPRPLQADAHDRRAILAAFDRGALDRPAGFGGELAEVDLGRIVEHQPQRVGAAEHRGGGRHREREFDLQHLAVAVQTGDDRRVRVGRRLARLRGLSRGRRRLRHSRCGRNGLERLEHRLVCRRLRRCGIIGHFRFGHLGLRGVGLSHLWLGRRRRCSRSLRHRGRLHGWSWFCRLCQHHARRLWRRRGRRALGRVRRRHVDHERHVAALRR